MFLDKHRKWNKLITMLAICSLLMSLVACDFSENEDYDDYGWDYEDYDEEWSDTEVDKSFVEKTTTTTEIEKSESCEIASQDISKYFSDGAIKDKKVQLKGDGTDTVTILIYMNGSNLESESGEATEDLSEMVAAGSSDKVNVLVQTMGTKKWEEKYNIASDRSQIYHVDGNGLTLVKDDLGQKDCTEEQSLADFIIWGAQNYPADRYILHFWNHGGGPVYGFGYDEWQSDEAALTIDEMQSALKKAGVYFDFVGMDCCLMSCMEVCCAFYDYCDYMILSEDFESGLGWEYTNWLKTLYKNTSIPTLELGKIICDDMVLANETKEGGDKSSMAIIDEAMMKVLFTAWTDFAYANESELLGTNYSRSVKRAIGGRVMPTIAKNTKSYDWNYDFYDYDEYGDSEENLSMAEYFVTDIMEVASSIESEKSDALSAALNSTLLYVKTTDSDAGLTGIAISLPYGDSNYYNNMKQIFLNIGLDSSYVDWLGKFVNVSNSATSQNHDSWDNYWNGWDDYYDDFDWDDWDYSDYNDDYWNDDYDWDNWEYENSWNEWSNENGWSDYDNYEERDNDDYRDDWYYGDDYWYDDWY